MKIALIGSAPSSVQLGPYYDKSYQQFLQAKPPSQYPPALYSEENWDIWVCSPGAYGIVPRATRWFEVHRWEPGQVWFSPEYCQFLREFRGPVYTGAPIPEIAHHIVYPYRRVEAEFSSYFLTSSLALMAAVAILDIQDLRKVREAKRAGSSIFETPAYQRLCETMPEEQIAEEAAKDDTDDVIGYWGVDMSANEEYSRQKPGCWFFILEALRRGIGHYAPPESDLNNPEMPYGLAEWDSDYIKHTTSMRMFNQRIQNAQAQINAAQQEMTATIGAKDVLAHQIKTHMNRDRLPAGVILRLNPGEGMGCRVDTIDGVPTEQAQGTALTMRG